MKRDPLISHFTDEEVRHKEIRLQPQNQGPSVGRTRAGMRGAHVSDGPAAARPHRRTRPRRLRGGRLPGAGTCVQACPPATGHHEPFVAAALSFSRASVPAVGTTAQGGGWTEGPRANVTFEGSNLQPLQRKQERAAVGGTPQRGPHAEDGGGGGTHRAAERPLSVGGSLRRDVHVTSRAGRCRSVAVC